MLAEVEKKEEAEARMKQKMMQVRSSSNE